MADIETFSDEDFRKVGVVAEFNPEWLSGKGRALAGKPVRVTKVNPKSLKVETEDGQTITTDAYMLVPTDKPFHQQEGPRLVLGSIGWEHVVLVRRTAPTAHLRALGRVA